jgi:hypothetical protein
MLGSLRRRVVRRAAFVLLLAIMGFTLEPVVGVVRDGEVHHETAAEAATHSGLATAGHAHEQNDSQTSEDSESDHEHGSNADHCTHSHGIAHPAVPSFEFFAALTWLEASYSRPIQSLLPTSATPPPNA